MDIVPQLRDRAAMTAAALTLLSGVLVCLAWLAGSPEATRLLPASSAVRFNTGLLLAAGGAGLLAGFGRRRWIAMACAAFTVLLATATLAEYLWRIDLGIDELLVPDPDPDPAAAMAPGRMAPNTAVTFLLGGLAMLFLAVRGRPWTIVIVQMLAALVLALGVVAAIGYAVDLAPAFQWAGLVRMALYTALSLVIFGTALMLAAVRASGVAAWHEMPWLAATLGIGVTALSTLGWYALRHAPDMPSIAIADLALALGLMTAALVSAAVAQARHLHEQAAALEGANAALQESEGSLQLLLDTVQTAVVVHGPDSAIRYANPAAARILGLSRDQLLGKTVIDPQWRFLREDGSPMPVNEYPVSLVAARKGPLHNYLVGIRAEPARPVRWVQVDAVPDFAPDGRMRLVIVSFVDVSERQHQTRELEQLALSDALTGLATRRHFLAEAERELKRARRGHALSLLVFDVDHFKSINDAHGHAAGDRVLAEIGRMVRGVLRESDLAGRLGGEEFGVLLPEAEEAFALAVAERLREAAAAVAVPLADSRELRFTLSVGAATLRDDDADVAALIARADAAMYLAKRAGRNRTQAAA